MAGENESGAATEVAPETTATEAAPAAAPPVEQQPSETEEGGSARARARTRYLAEREKASHHSRHQDRNDSGRFAEGSGSADETDQGAADATAATDTAVDTTEEAKTGAAEAAAPTEAGDEQKATKESPSGLVRIELAEDDPLRAQGVTYIEATPGQERHIRALLNRQSHRRDLEAASRTVQEERARREEIEQQVIRLRAELKAKDRLRDRLLTDEEVRAEYEELQTTNPERAKRLLRFLEEEIQPEVDREVDEQLDTKRVEAVQKQAVAFRRDVYGAVGRAYPMVARLPHIEEVVEQAITSYGAYIARLERRGEQPQLDMEFFRKNHLHAAFMADNEVRQTLGRVWQEQRTREQRERDQQAAEKAKREAEADGRKREEERLRDAAARHGTMNPVAQIPASVRTDHSSTEREDAFDPLGMPAAEIKRRQRQRTLGR